MKSGREGFLSPGGRRLNVYERVLAVGICFTHSCFDMISQGGDGQSDHPGVEFEKCEEILPIGGKIPLGGIKFYRHLVVGSLRNP